MKRLCSKKEKAYLEAKHKGTKAEWDKFCCIRKKVDRSLRKAHKQHVQAIVESEDPKTFWRYVRSRRQDNTGVQPLKVNNKLITSDLGKAEALANQFQSVFTRENTDSTTMPSLPNSPYPDMPEITIQIEGVKKLLNGINVSKAIGPDEIPNQALKITADEIAPILAFISNNPWILASSHSIGEVQKFFLSSRRETLLILPTTDLYRWPAHAANYNW